MKHITYHTQNTCAKKIDFDITDDNKITNLNFHGGCLGNLSAIAKLVEGKDAKEIANILAGNTCGLKSTSCSDQLSKAILDNLNN